MAKKVFVTGFIGTAIVSKLIHSRYQVLGLTRSEHGKRSLLTAGAEILEGNVGDLSILRRAANAADAIIHTAFNHDFTKFKENCEADRKAIGALGEVLSDSHPPFVVTSGTSVANVGPGEVATEQNLGADSAVSPRAAGEGLHIPVVSLASDEANADFTWFAPFAGRNNLASSKFTQQELGWHPAEPGLIADLRKMFNL